MYFIADKYIVNKLKKYSGTFQPQSIVLLLEDETLATQMHLLCAWLDFDCDFILSCFKDFSPCWFDDKYLVS
jgi:hypothetical protein